MIRVMSEIRPPFNSEDDWFRCIAIGGPITTKIKTMLTVPLWTRAVHYSIAVVDLDDPFLPGIFLPTDTTMKVGEDRTVVFP
ncbi:MAG: hypothetical protein ACRD2A_09830 [Vicinamibacterales bacterium]